MVLHQSWETYITDRLHLAHEKNQHRSMKVFDSFQPGYLIRNGKQILNLCSNDYLGLASDAEGKEEAKLLADILPYGGGASRLVTGNLAIHHELEKSLAAWKGTEGAVIFPSGYQTNVGLLSSLAAKGDAIFCDRLNHASLLDGCRLSGATLHRYRHNDLDDLETLLKTKRPRKRIIVTDGVFSMDGDIAPLREIYQLAKGYGAILIVDEAHATGVLGEKGAGSWSHFGLPLDDNIILMGTLSKAVGGQGGYVCASKKMVDYLTNYCRALIYSTSLSPLLAGLAHYNIHRIQDQPELIDSLNQACQTFKQALTENQVPFEDSSTPILPIILGSSQKAIQCSERLMEQDIAAAAIRPPTVPEGTSRLRVSVSASHSANDLTRAAKAVAETLQEPKEE
ncbi:8-amino-7-oxononanoate synthase [bacterium]|nr:8-amino-7-oxononanoate synthase [bacterium]